MQSTHFLNNIFSLGPTYTKILFPKCLLICVQRGTLRREILDLCFHLPITTQVSFLINKNYMCFSCSTRCFDEYEEWYDYCCCCSVAQLCLTRQPHGLQPPGLPVPHHIPKFAQVHVHCIGNAIQSSHPLMPSSPSVLSLSQHKGLFQWVGNSHHMTKILENDQNSASASVLPLNIQDWFPFRLTGLISLLSKALSGVFSSTTVRRHQFFGGLPSLWSSSHNRMWPLGRP